MYPHSSFLIALGAWPTLGKAGFRVRPDRPDIPVSPPRNPYNHDPVVPGFTYPGYDRIQIPPQAELQTNMQSLEQRLEAVNVALDAGEEVVQAILAVVSTTITSVDMTCKSHLPSLYIPKRMLMSGKLHQQQPSHQPPTQPASPTPASSIPAPLPLTPSTRCPPLPRPPVSATHPVPTHPFPAQIAACRELPFKHWT
jgi:hypothetical protein